MSAPESVRFSVQLFAATSSGPVNWRLLSANNRECGRGHGQFAGTAECRQFVALLQRRTGDLAPRCRRGPTGKWGWELRADGDVVASSGHRFDRLVRCELAAAMFVDGFVQAPMRDTMIVSTARRWGTVA